MYPILAISQGQVPTGILPGHGDDCYPPCQQTRVSYYAPEVLKEEHRRSVAAQGVSGYELDRVLPLGAILENPKSPQILLLAQDCLGALALPRTGIKTKANAIYAPYPASHPGFLPQYSYVLAVLDRY